MAGRGCPGEDVEDKHQERHVELRELINGEIETVSADTTVAEAAEEMQAAGVGSLAVLDEDVFSGIFTERDVLRVVATGAEASVETVAEWMTLYPDSFLPDMDVREAADWMLAAGYRHLPMVEDGRLIGMASIKDILWALTGERTA
jgi:CBS domain-containing protein